MGMDSVTLKAARSVLIVDDDSSGRAMLALSLRRAGFSVHTAASGPEALEQLAHETPDWLITDAMMEPMNGFELSLQAKALAPEVKIAMISAMYSAKDAQAFPIDRFLPKPLHVEDLLAALAL